MVWWGKQGNRAWAMELKGLGDLFAKVSSMSESGQARCTTMDLGILK